MGNNPSVAPMAAPMNAPDPLQEIIEPVIEGLNGQAANSQGATTPPSLPADVIPSIENDLYWIISLVLIALFYLGIPLVLVLLCGCRKENYVPSTGWLADETDLDMDLLSKGEGASGPEEGVKKKKKTRILGLSPYSVEVWLSRNAKLVSFLIMTIMGMMLLLLYGVFLETILYEDKETDLLAIAIPIGRGMGVVTNFSMLLVLFFMARFPLTTLSSTPLSVILPLEVSFELHKVYAFITFFAGTIHGVLQTVNFATNPNMNQTWDAIAYRTVFGGRSTFVSGWILYGVFLAMLLTFFKPVKSCFGYQGFLNVHKLWIVFLILLFLHGNEKGVPVFWKWGIAPTILLGWHYGVQHFSSTKKTKSIIVLEKCSVDKKAKIIRLEVLRGQFNFKAGQYAFITVPELGPEKHPFTIASSPSEETVTFFIKVFGDWTTQLFNLIESRKTSKVNLGPLHCTMRGGFGAPTEFAYQYNDVVLIGTGVGATPFISLMKDIIWQNSIRDFLTEEAFKLSSDPEAAKKNIRANQEVIHDMEQQHLISKNKKVKTVKRKKIKFFNRYSYGVFWQWTLSIFIVLTYVDSAPFNENTLNSNLVPVTDLPAVTEFQGVFYEILYALWYVYALMILLGYTIDFIYRCVHESSHMSKRQMGEITIHSVFYVWVIVVIIYRGVFREGFEYDFALATMLLAACSNLSWFLYVNRIAGNRLTANRHEIVKQTNSLRFIYLDKNFTGADWIVEELLNVDKLSSAKMSSVKINIDVYFSRDTSPPENKQWAESSIISTYTGRPDWNMVIRMLMDIYETAKMDKVSMELEDAKKTGLILDEDDFGGSVENVIGMFFCGNPVVGDIVRKAVAKETVTRNFSIVWHQEAFG